MSPARDPKQSFFVNQFEESSKRNHGGESIERAIIEKESLRREASGRHLGGIWYASGMHLGSIWEASTLGFPPSLNKHNHSINIEYNIKLVSLQHVQLPRRHLKSYRIITIECMQLQVQTCFWTKYLDPNW
jgi:hypothetical protein